MNILFAWRRLTPPGFIGGAEITEAAFARSLAGAGHSVTFLGSAENPRQPSETSLPWLMELLAAAEVPYETTRDTIDYVWNGVECRVMAQKDLLRAVAGRARGADAIWTSQEGCPQIRASASTVEAATYVHSVSPTGLLSAQTRAQWIFVPSLFVANTINRDFGLSTHLLRPPIAPAPIPTSAPGDAVLFVNPIEEKGVKLALEIAHRCRDIPFIFVEGWREIDSNLKPPTNVEVVKRQRTLEAIYARSRLLLVPSTVPDASPRVVVEAALRGLPALGSNRGGIPELISSAEDVLDPTQPDAWIKRLRQLLGNRRDWELASRRQYRLGRSLQQDPLDVFHAAGFPPDLQNSR